MILMLIGIGIILSCNWIIEGTTKPYVYSDINQIPTTKVGLVLGTSEYVATGKINYYFKYRIDAAAKLYHSGKIKYIIVSGDNGTRYYNEPRAMINALVKKGVPRSKIFPDYAGFRTLDSVIRCREIFSQNRFIIISQEFHNERAVFLARYNKMEAYAYNAKQAKNSFWLKSNGREILARVKVFIDILTQKQPKFGGKKIEIK